jgi:hypothetical protein
LTRHAATEIRKTPLEIGPDGDNAKLTIFDRKALVEELCLNLVCPGGILAIDKDSAGDVMHPGRVVPVVPPLVI